MVDGNEADGVVADGLQLGVVGEVAGTDQLDAGGSHAERAIGAHHGAAECSPVY